MAILEGIGTGKCKFEYVFSDKSYVNKIWRCVRTLFGYGVDPIANRTRTLNWELIGRCGDYFKRVQGNNIQDRCILEVHSKEGWCYHH